MSDPVESNTLQQRKKSSKRLRTDIVVGCIPVVLLLVFVLTRPLYVAGRINSVWVRFGAEINAFLIIVTCVCGSSWLALRFAVHLARRRFKQGMVCCALACVVICSFFAFRPIAWSNHYRFSCGFREWVLENVDLGAIEDWRATLELAEKEYPRKIAKKDWPSFVTVLSPDSVACFEFEEDKIELIVRWRGIGQSWGLTFCPKESKPQLYQTQLEVSPGVHFWTFSTH